MGELILESGEISEEEVKIGFLDVRGVEWNVVWY